MNFVLLCDKKQRQYYERIIKKDDAAALLGTETLINDNFVSKIFEEYNPHGVIIDRAVKTDTDLTAADIAVALKKFRSSARIIFIYGEISEDNQSDFNVVYRTLTEHSIYEIVTKQDFDVLFPALIKSAMTKTDLDESLKTEETETVIFQQNETQESIYDTTIGAAVKFDKEALNINAFDMLTIDKITETNTEQMVLSCIVIGITELQHHIGCTHISFEIAAYLLRQKKKVCVIISDANTYGSMVGFYGIPESFADDGFLIAGIRVFSLSKLELAKSEFNYIVCDFGVLQSEQRVLFDDCPVKIMLCSAADWDLTVTTDFINGATTPYIRDINYCFYPVNQSKFISFNKQMLKAGCKAYRLHTSTGCFQPCDGNAIVYGDILKRYTTIVPEQVKKQKKPAPKRQKADVNYQKVAYIAGGGLVAVILLILTVLDLLGVIGGIDEEVAAQNTTVAVSTALSKVTATDEKEPTTRTTVTTETEPTETTETEAEAEPEPKEDSEANRGDYPEYSDDEDIPDITAPVEDLIRLQFPGVSFR
ncbi:hypothetical protein FACS1894133_2250 [Clostridia bacterium]|nr:hypothetical protein FACS1894133_2250 [Clostridia bacterium]